MAGMCQLERGAAVAAVAVALLGAGCQSDQRMYADSAQGISARGRAVPENPAPSAEDAVREIGFEQLDNSIPAPPFANSPRRSPSIDAQIPHAGNEACDFAPSALIDHSAGTAGLISSPVQSELGLGWAMYRFDELNPSALPALLEVSLQGDLPENYYIGLSDYRSRRWVWTSVSAPSGADSALVNGRDAISPYGQLYCVIAVYGGESLTISSLSLQASLEMPPPEEFEATTDLPDAIHLSWTDPAISFDPDGPGPQVFNYDVIWIEQSASPSGPWTVLTGVYGGEVKLLLDGSNELTVPSPDTETFYRARCGTFTESGPPGNATRGLRRLGIPGNLQATDGSLYDRVRVSWEPVLNASSYDVYIGPGDNPDVISGIIGSTSNTYFDQMVNSINTMPVIDSAYTYWVVARSVGGAQSAPSATDTGYRSLPVPQNLYASDGTSVDSITISWNPVAGAEQYIVSYGINSYSCSSYLLVEAATQCTLQVPPNTDSNNFFAFRVAVDIGIDSRYLHYSEMNIGHAAYKLLAKLQATPGSGTAPLLVELATVGSGAPDSDITNYEWDFDGDGDYELMTGSGVPAVQHSYLEGTFNPVVRITDDLGRTNTATTQVISTDP